MAVTSANGALARLERRDLKRKLARATFRDKIRALALVMPLLLFVVVTFLTPIADMLFRSVENQIVGDTLPRTVAALAHWDPTQSELPDESAFEAVITDLRAAAKIKIHTKVGQRLNYEAPGVASLFRKTPRKLSARSKSKQEKIDAEQAAIGAKAFLIKIDQNWGKPVVWTAIKQYSGRYTVGYFLSALDLKQSVDGGITAKPEEQQIYIDLFVRTLWLSTLITFLTLLLGFPVAYLLATLPNKTANLLMILVLLPFWTSLLVRTSAWIVLLQQQGIVNDLLVATGINSPLYTALRLFGAPDVSSLCQDNLNAILSQGVAEIARMIASETVTLSSCAKDVAAVFQANGAEAALAHAQTLKAAGDSAGYGDERFAMIFNQTGTIVAMTHILLPFMILPLYAVMKTIPPSYVRAAKSLGATNYTAFVRVYFPNTIPGIGAGAVLVFILAIGYYITPELVGGTRGTFISNRIAYHISLSLNWGLGAALGALLLGAVLVLYYVYDRIVGIDNVKLG